MKRLNKYVYSVNTTRIKSACLMPSSEVKEKLVTGIKYAIDLSKNLSVDLRSCL